MIALFVDALIPMLLITDFPLFIVSFFLKPKYKRKNINSGVW